MKKLLPFLLMAFLDVFVVSAEVCFPEINLYEQRSKLVKEYAEKVGNNYLGKKKTADDLIFRRKKIDQKYYLILNNISEAYYSKNDLEMERCCPDFKKDPIIFRTCKLVKFLSKKIDSAEFIEAYPKTITDFEEFWALDEVVYGFQNAGQEKMPRLFLSEGPVELINKQMDSLMVSGNKDAIKKVLNSFDFVDGEMAETLNERIASFVSSHYDLVLKHWGIFREYRSRLINCLQDARNKEEILKIERLVEKRKMGSKKNRLEFIEVLKKATDLP